MGVFFPSSENSADRTPCLNRLRHIKEKDTFKVVISILIVKNIPSISTPTV